MTEVTFDQAYPFARRAAQVRAAAAVMTGIIPQADREDFEQEGLAACWRALPRFDPSRASLRTFCERIVAARLATLVRSALRVPPSEPLEVVGEIPVRSGFSDVEFLASLESVLARLRPADRRLVLLLLDHTPAEAGRILGVSRSTVHDRIVRLRPLLGAAGCAAPIQRLRGGAW